MLLFTFFTNTILYIKIFSQQQNIKAEKIINKFMSVSHSPPRIFDQLENAYHDDNNRCQSQQQQNKFNFYRIAQMQNARNQERKKIDKQWKDYENQKIRDYWDMHNEIHMQNLRRKKQQIDDVRKVNQSMSLQIMNNKTKQQYQPRNDFNEYYDHEYQRQKKQREEFLKQANQYHSIRKMKQKREKQLDLEVAHYKQRQQQELVRKRESQLKRIRDKHQQIPQTYFQLNDLLAQKKKQEQLLDAYIINKGATDQQARILERRAQFEVKQRQRRNNYIRDLKRQFEDDMQQQFIDKQQEVESQRRKIDERNRYFSEVDKSIKAHKKAENSKTIEVLKHQMKPRNLLQEPDRLEKVGLGSPANIGKVVGDDRKRQLDWIQKSLLRQMPY